MVKNKIALNLTKRQLICFSLGAAVAVPSYLFIKKYIMTDISVFLMIALAMPFFFLALYEKNGLPFERVAWNMIRVKFILPNTRPYQMENFYRKLQNHIEYKGVNTIVPKNKSAIYRKKETTEEKTE